MKPIYDIVPVSDTISVIELRSKRFNISVAYPKYDANRKRAAIKEFWEKYETAIANDKILNP